MTYTPSFETAASTDASSRKRVSQITTILDAKTLDADDPYIWGIAGTGTNTFTGNINRMSVTAGQYVIRQSKYYSPYFSGKSQVVEMTFDSFAYETGVVKRVGYFTDDGASAPYTANLDGWFLESNGSTNTYYLVIYNKGTLTASIPFADWDGYDQLVDYDWDNFTIMLADFLWLGGSELRVMIKSPDSSKFILAHTYRHAGNDTGVFIRTPQQPLRYEIRSTTGTGTFNAICGYVGSEGSIGEGGEVLGIYNSSSINLTTGSTYVLCGVRKAVAYPSSPARISNVGIMVTSNDGGILMLLEDPVVSGTLTWSSSSHVETTLGNGSQTITTNGRVLSATPVVSAGVVSQLASNILSWMGSNIDKTGKRYILAYRPLTTNQNVAGTLNIVEY